MSAKTLISLEKVYKTFTDRPVPTRVLRNINLKIQSGEFVAIMGASGSGKTTLMNVIGLLDRPTSGSYQLADINITKLKDKQLAQLRRQAIGFVFQSFNLLGRMSVRGNVELPMMYNRLRRSQRKERSEALLKLVGLGNRQGYKPTQLSGGQLQRVAIARALANHPKLILADEPTGNLDSKNGTLIMKVLKKLNQRGNTIIVITHDINVASQAGRIIQIKDGRIEIAKQNVPLHKRRSKKL